jgi:Raf kinase inhibitor-like YbhB/YbcL family protein
MPLVLSSPDFQSQGQIPRELTCEGADLSPSLSWAGAPAGTQSFALIVDDPDAPDPARPQRVWVHWVLYNLPAQLTSLPRGVKSAPEGALDGFNDWNKPGYGGPCPPVGRHRYFHKLYALDTALPNLGRATKSELEKAMAGHILAQSELIGTYEKAKK